MPFNIYRESLLNAAKPPKTDTVNLQAGGVADRAMSGQPSMYQYADQINPNALARAYAAQPPMPQKGNDYSKGFSDWANKYGTQNPQNVTPASNNVSGLRDMVNQIQPIENNQNIFQKFSEAMRSPEVIDGIKRFFFGDIVDPNTASLDQLRNARHGFIGDLGDALSVGGGGNPMYAQNIQSRYEKALNADKYNRDMAMKEAQSRSDIANQDANTSGLNIDNQYRPIFNSQKAVENQNAINKGYLDNADAYREYKLPKQKVIGNGMVMVENPSGTGYEIRAYANPNAASGKGRMGVDEAMSQVESVYGSGWRSNPEANSMLTRLVTGGNMPANLTDKGNVSPSQKVQQEEQSAIDTIAKNLGVDKVTAAKIHYKVGEYASGGGDSSVRIINGHPARNADGSYRYDLMSGVSHPVFRTLADDPKLHISNIKTMPDYLSEDSASTYKQDLSKYAPKRFDAMTQEARVINNLWRAKALLQEMQKTGAFSLTGGTLLASPLARKYAALQSQLDADMKKAGRLDATVTNYDSRNLAMQVPKLGVFEGGVGVINTYDNINSKIDAALATYGDAFKAMDTQWGHGARAFNVDRIIH